MILTHKLTKEYCQKIDKPSKESAQHIMESNFIAITKKHNIRNVEKIAWLGTQNASGRYVGTSINGLLLSSILAHGLSYCIHNINAVYDKYECPSNWQLIGGWWDVYFNPFNNDPQRTYYTIPKDNANANSSTKVHIDSLCVETPHIVPHIVPLQGI